MKKIVTLVFSIICYTVIAQDNNDVLFTINNSPTTVGEFKKAYEKNIDLVKDKKARDIDANLDLYINYKLKVQQAYNLKLDTVKSYVREYNTYKTQLIAPYLHDKDFESKMIQQAYNRTLEEVRASHILLSFPKRGQEKDTLAILEKLEKARQRVINGEDFAKVAKEISADPSAKTNGGDLGYFSAFKMVYPFENVAYNTDVGEVSKPFRTRFGYHILKVTGKRQSKGKFEVAHIFAKDKSVIGKAKIDSVYSKLESGANFEDLAKKYSDDKVSGLKGGKLPVFGTGKMVAEFENQVLNLKTGETSKPFQTKFGWHIVKLINNYPIASFDKMKLSLKQKVKSGVLGNLSKKAMIDKLKAKYTVKIDESVLKTVLNKKKVNKTLLIINDKQINASDFNRFATNKGKVVTKSLFNDFLDDEILNYFKEDLEQNDDDFKYTLQEYRDGLLLFNLIQDKIWSKSVNNNEGLEEFYKTNSKKYKQPLKEIKGTVVNDYQQYLEDNWIQQLRSNNNISINQKTLKELKKAYNQ